ncbi:FHA domain-containing protein, partial [Pyxidicoccus fallax]
MASLTVRSPDGKVRSVSLLKRITSIGRGPDNDVQLEDPGVPDSALHVTFDGSRYEVGSLGATFHVNGKKRDAHALSTGDVVKVGGTELTFAREDA